MFLSIFDFESIFIAISSMSFGGLIFLLGMLFKRFKNRNLSSNDLIGTLAFLSLQIPIGMRIYIHNGVDGILNTLEFEYYIPIVVIILFIINIYFSNKDKNLIHPIELFEEAYIDYKKKAGKNFESKLYKNKRLGMLKIKDNEDKEKIKLELINLIEKYS
jgi:hypothetical protein